MSLIQWNDEVFSVGVRKMDEQHKQLIGLINALHAQKDSQDREFIDRVFTTLIHYTKKHFADEERLLKKIHWSRLDSHHQQHVKFIHTVADMKQVYDKKGGSPEPITKLTGFLRDWITHHILAEDMAHGRYLEE